MAIEQRAVHSAEDRHEEVQRRPWQTPVLREIEVERGTEGKTHLSIEITGTLIHFGVS